MKINGKSNPDDLQSPLFSAIMHDAEQPEWIGCSYIISLLKILTKDFYQMAIRIKARGGESAEQMLRRFKKLCEKEGLTKDVKKNAYYEKPSERKRRAMRKSVKRTGP